MKNVRGVDIQYAANTIAKHTKIQFKQVVVDLDIQKSMASQ